MIHTIRIEEAERQALLLAMAKLSLERPGWDEMLNDLALKMDNRSTQGRAILYDRFRTLHAQVEQQIQGLVDDLRATKR